MKIRSMINDKVKVMGEDYEISAFLHPIFYSDRCRKFYVIFYIHLRCRK